MILEYLNALRPPYGEIILTIVGVVALWLAYKFGKFTTALRSNISQKKMKEDHLMVQRSLTESWEVTKDKLEGEIASLKAEVSALNNKNSEYRHKIAGTGGVFSSNQTKKRSELIETTLLENEMLHQIIRLSKGGADVSKLVSKLDEHTKKQLLMSNIFKDEKLHNYVQDLVEEYLRKPEK